MAKFFLESFEITLSDIRAVAAEATNAIRLILWKEYQWSRYVYQMISSFHSQHFLKCYYTAIWDAILRDVDQTLYLFNTQLAAMQMYGF